MALTVTVLPLLSLLVPFCARFPTGTRLFRPLLLHTKVLHDVVFFFVVADLTGLAVNTYYTTVRSHTCNIKKGFTTCTHCHCSVILHTATSIMLQGV